jgi:hypothetical protein
VAARQLIIPSHFYLKRRKWTVDITEDVLYAADGDVCNGLCHPDTRTIEIAAQLGPKRRLQIFVHEFLHAVEFEYGIVIPHKVIYLLERPLVYLLQILIDGVD